MERNTEQLDFFFDAMVGDLRIKDDVQSMVLPLCSLSKRKRTSPISWKKGNHFVQVTAPLEYGICTIYDLDIIMYCISQLNEQFDRGTSNPEPTIRTTYHDLLTKIGRKASGRDYIDIKHALNRLTATYIETNIRAPSANHTVGFHWLEEFRTDENSKKILLKVPRWIYEGVIHERSILTIDKNYFNLSSGIARYLYRLCRKSAGRKSEGQMWYMQTVYENSGSTMNFPDFCKSARKVIDKLNEKDNFPEYQVFIKTQNGREAIQFLPRPETIGQTIT
mgnify:CR=1 FL=1